jgi:nucleoside-diphosphate-sugar epimerase
MHHSNKASVAIIGCGWFGLPLAQQLMQQHYSVLVSTTQAAKQQRLQQFGLTALLLSLPSSAESLRQSALLQTDIVIIAIPPKLRYGQTDYASNIASLVTALRNTRCRQIILISTTAVYQGLTGLVTEQTVLNLANNKTQIIALAEQQVLASNSAQRHACVLRLAGLVGPKRYPGNFFAGKSQLTDANAPVQLIHQQDAVGIVIKLIEQQQSGIFNAVSATRANKQSFYQHACRARNLTLPKFTPPIENVATEQYRMISSDKVRQQLHYSFIYDDLMPWLSASALQERQ